MTAFRAFRVHESDGGGAEARLDTIGLDDLSPGEVTIRAAWSGINYKDALAVTGKGKIMRRMPMVAGIDVAGTVEASDDARFAPGAPVLVAGASMSESYDGGYAEQVRAPADAVVGLPSGLSAREAMALGTAGFTAALAIERMEHNGQRPENGPVLVNGATGGVGTIAIDMLAARGYEVVALTGKAADAGDWLKQLGAARVMGRDEIETKGRPLEATLWAGAIDNVGGDQLGWLTRTVMPAGNIAAIGLAGGPKLETTVMPFILRGVNLLGINSVTIPSELREHAWRRCGTDLKPRHLDAIVTREIALGDLDAAVFEEYMASSVKGRTLIRIADDA